MVDTILERITDFEDLKIFSDHEFVFNFIYSLYELL